LSHPGQVLFALCLVGLFAAFTSGQARPPEGADPDSEIAKWFHSLKTEGGQSCCDVSDCRPVEARLTDEGYEILLYRWQKVSKEKVRKVANMIGKPIACFNAMAAEFAPPELPLSEYYPDLFIYCFIPVSLVLEQHSLRHMS
jgi:hypothetical protein